MIIVYLRRSVTERLTFLYDGRNIYLNTPVRNKVLKIGEGPTRYSTHAEVVELCDKSLVTCSDKGLAPVGGSRQDGRGHQ